MFSWFTGNNNNDKNDDQNLNGNDINNADQSIFEDTETKSAEMESSDDKIPTIDNYPLHAAIIQKDIQSLKKHIALLPKFNPLHPAKTRPINQKDHHGYTALHLAVYLSFHEGIDILIKNGASVTVRNRSGWNCVQESISTSQRDILRKLFLKNMDEVREGIALRSPIIRKKLQQRDDFYVEIDWKFSSWIPFISRFCPCDTFKIWKRGSDFRLDMTLIDFESYSWKRGHLSFVFIMNEKTDKASFYVLNHTKKTKAVTNKEKEMEQSKDEKEIEQSLEHLMQSELVSPEIFTSKIVIEESKNWLGSEKFVEINDKKCKLFELKNLVVLANKKDDHMPKEVKEEKALSKQIFAKKMEAAKNGKNEFEIESIDDLENEQKNDDEKSTKIKSKTMNKKGIKDMFGDVKKYNYPKYVPPKIKIEEYFDVNEWKKHKVNERNNHNKKSNVSTEILNDRKETFVINKAQSTLGTKSFKLNLAMAESFGLSIEEILAILEAAAPQSKLAAKLKEFLEIKMPKGFPIRLELPLFHVLKGTVTFQNFEHINPSDDLFLIPDDYELVESEKKE